MSRIDVYSPLYSSPVVCGVVLFAFLLTLSAALQASVSDRPHVVVILADDLGWQDVGYNGSEIETPLLDKLAQTGVRLDQFYAQPTCSPTRASLMTGQAALRLGVLQPINKNLKRSLPLSLAIMPQYFGEAGYQSVMAGKWHLGHASRAQLPNARGFEHSYGNVTGGVGYWDHRHGGGLDWHRNGKVLREEGYATHLVAAESVRLIESRDRERPLFLYVAFNAPHLPNEAPIETVDKYRQIENPNRRVHAAMVDELDQAVGQILTALEKADMADNTLVWFMSDNGGLKPGANPPVAEKAVAWLTDWFGRPLPDFGGLEFLRTNVEDGGSNNGPYRRGKGSVYQGGVLVPSVISWPGSLDARRVKGRITVQDVLPTLASVAGLSLREDQAVDGRSQWPAIADGTVQKAPDFVIKGFDGEALYHDQWKLVVENQDAPELYNMTQDKTEQINLAAVHPEQLSALQDRLADYPRGASIHETPLWRILLDPDAFGGEEDREPWADRVKD
ncbi:MAG: arylsulfatase [Halieaceae bacterium]|jgi:arylsulfatase A-like enzyme|nr:arylsulfatase [Halieaceae bacterium]